MPKYKYVDGVKYRVVPQSVLGYALVKEDSDNSLPSGGTEGQVLAKASNTDYDVEWSTVESGGDGVTITYFECEVDTSQETVTIDATKVLDYCDEIESGKLPVLKWKHSGGSDEFLAYPYQIKMSDLEGTYQYSCFFNLGTIDRFSEVELTVKTNGTYVASYTTH